MKEAQLVNLLGKNLLPHLPASFIKAASKCSQFNVVLWRIYQLKDFRGFDNGNGLAKIFFNLVGYVVDINQFRLVVENRN